MTSNGTRNRNTNDLAYWNAVSRGRNPLSRVALVIAPPAFARMPLARMAGLCDQANFPTESGTYPHDSGKAAKYAMDIPTDKQFTACHTPEGGTNDVRICTHIEPTDTPVDRHAIVAGRCSLCRRPQLKDRPPRRSVARLPPLSMCYRAISSYGYS